MQAHWANDAIDAAISVTTGTLSYPRVSDDNDSKQIAGRVALRPVVGLLVADPHGAAGCRSGFEWAR